MEVILEMSFLNFSNINIWFTEKTITWKRYRAIKTLSITKKVKLINNQNIFVNSKTFVVYRVIFDINNIKIAIYLFLASQIRLLKIEKTFITNFTKYSNDIDVFLSEFTAKLP